MPLPIARSRPKLTSSQRRVLALLVISGFLNYFDRSNLSVGATDISRDLGLNMDQLGLLLSAFFWSYALFQLVGVSGWVVDRLNVCWVLAAGFFLWSGATAITGAARSFALVFGLRLVLGVGESIAYPSYSRILASTFPEDHRGFANALIDAGTKFGPALGTLLGGLLMASYGWRAFFVMLGAVSLMWLAPWYVVMPRHPGLGSRPPGTVHSAQVVPSLVEIFRHRSAIFSALLLFCSNYYWYFLLTWLPPYLEEARHFSKSKMAFTGSASYFLIAAVSVSAGRLSDRWIHRGATPTLVRKTFGGLGLLFSTLLLPVAVIRDETSALVLLMLASVCYGFYTSNVWAITQTLAGPRAAGKWTGVQNGFGNLSGVVAPWFTGWVVGRTGSFFWAFAVASGVALAGAAILVFGMGRIEQVQFRD
ncbi:MAG: MFS transporter [Bryobacteraceae bacterium]